MDSYNKLSNLGLSDQKIKETLKNPSLTHILVSISEQVSLYIYW